MKTIFLFLFGIAAVSAQFGGLGLGGNVLNRVQGGVNRVTSGLPSLPALTNVNNFGDYLAQTGKTYASNADRALRQGLFDARKTVVDTKNAAFAAGTLSYESAINAFSDLTNAEFLTYLTGNRKSAEGDAKAQKNRKLAKPVTGKNIPDSFDWRTKGGVTPVKYQMECGSCWSFATTGAVEGHVFRKTGKLPNLSEQNLIDCGKEEFGLAGCDGGFQEYGFNFITEQKGIAAGEKYPYLNKKGSCSYKSGLKDAEITGFATITPNDEKTMKEVIATLGPLACSVNGLESLLVYKQGIYSDEECNKGEVNHSVLVVGYGSEKGKDFWIVKNSWDKNWGEEGYFRLPRGKNFCGIASECSYPIV